MSYLLIKQLHVACVTLSLAGFVLRGGLMLRQSPWLESRVARTLPHVVDTVLLASATALTLQLHQYPFVNAWLTAKVTGLLAYILLGAIALRRGQTKTQRLAAWVAALMVFGYIISVAITKNSAGLLG